MRTEMLLHALRTQGVVLRLLVCLVITACSSTSIFDRAPFDEAVWKAERNKALNSDLRWKMVDSLLRNHENLIGMSRAEILSLLGPPDQRFPMEASNTTAEEFGYHLGQLQSGEDVTLAILFSGERVYEARVDT
jgi:hypothetical protein